MSLRGEIERRWYLPAAFNPPKVALLAVCKKIAARFPEEGVFKPHDRDCLLEKLRLKQPFSEFSKRERRLLHFVLFAESLRGACDEDFFREYLLWVEENWVSGPKRLWSRYVLSMHGESVLMELLGPWMSRMLDSGRLTESQVSLSRAWRLFERSASLALMAERLLHGGRRSFSSMESMLRRDVFLGSGLLCELLRRMGTLLAEGCDDDLADVPTAISSDFCEPTTLHQRIMATDAPESLKAQSINSIVKGIILWAEDHQASSRKETALTFFKKNLGDPRLNGSGWRRVDYELRKTVERWINQDTIERFFDVVNELGLDPTWVERREFWRCYFHAIDKAWLVAGRHASGLANKMGVECARLGGGSKTHCGLLMQIGSLVVFEMNKEGSTIFFNASDPNAPPFYKKDVIDRNWSLMSLGNKLAHRGAWKSRFSDYIANETGIRMRRPSP
jgi:hypothetical protein